MHLAINNRDLVIIIEFKQHNLSIDDMGELFLAMHFLAFFLNQVYR